MKCRVLRPSGVPTAGHERQEPRNEGESIFLVAGTFCFPLCQVSILKWAEGFRDRCQWPRLVRKAGQRGPRNGPYQRHSGRTWPATARPGPGPSPWLPLPRSPFCAGNEGIPIGNPTAHCPWRPSGVCARTANGHRGRDREAFVGLVLFRLLLRLFCCLSLCPAVARVLRVTVSSGGVPGGRQRD